MRKQGGFMKRPRLKYSGIFNAVMLMKLHLDISWHLPSKQKEYLSVQPITMLLPVRHMKVVTGHLYGQGIFRHFFMGHMTWEAPMFIASTRIVLIAG